MMNIYEMIYSVVSEEGRKPVVENNLVRADSEKEAISIIEEKLKRMGYKLNKVYSVEFYNQGLWEKKDIKTVSKKYEFIDRGVK